MSIKKDYDIRYKVLVVGESTVGKSSIIRMLSRPDEELPCSLVTTVGKWYEITIINKNWNYNCIN